MPKKIVISPSALYQQLTDETILLNCQTETYSSLDATGTRMWQLLAEHGDTEIVVSYMLAEYEIDEARLREDLAGIIAHLVEAGLVTEQT